MKTIKLVLQPPNLKSLTMGLNLVKSNPKAIIIFLQFKLKFDYRNNNVISTSPKFHFV